MFEGHAAFVGDAIVFTVDLEGVQILIVPTHGIFNDTVQLGQ